MYTANYYATIDIPAIVTRNEEKKTHSRDKTEDLLRNFTNGE